MEANNKTKILFTGQIYDGASDEQKLCCHKCGREEGALSKVYINGKLEARILTLDAKECETGDAHICLPICDECILIETAELKSIRVIIASFLTFSAGLS